VTLRTPSPRSAVAARLVLLLTAALLAADATGPAFAATPNRHVAAPLPKPAEAPEAAAVDPAPGLDLGLLARSDAGDPFAGGGVQPGIQYEDATAHAADPNTFSPGGRVSVGFRPRAADGWAVDGGRPLALPGGRATGRQMAASPQGSRWAGTGRGSTPGGAGAAGDGPTPVDQPTDPNAIDAAPATFVGDSPLVTSGGAGPAAANGLRRQVFGFLPYWEVGSSGTVLNYSLLSTIAYFSVGATGHGNLRKKNADGSVTTGWGGWTSSAMTKVINNAHSAGSRVVLTLSVFAWSSTEAAVQASILGSPANRLRLAQQTAAAVRDRGADGVNLDFEPIASGYGVQFVAFVKTLRAELDKIRKGYQLTFDTTGYVGNYQVAQLISAGADAMFLMGYDFRTSGSSPVGSIAPLAGPAYDINDSLDAFLALVPASRIILGVPYYGRAWSTTTSTLNASNRSGAKYGYSVSVTYVNAIDLLKQYGRHYDPLEKVAWTAYQKQTCTTAYGCVTSWRQLYVDDATALGAKYDLANRLGLRGVGMWALGYDATRPELYAELNAKFLHDTTLPEAGIRVLPSAAGDEGFVVRWTGSDDVGVTGYDVQVAVDGGTWATWKSRTTATSDVWLGSNGHTYGFRVRARDTSGNWSAWNVAQTGAGTPALRRGAFGTVVTDGLSLRTAPTTSATKVGTASSGEVYAITGGPVSADGYTWYEVTGPLSAWNAVGQTQVGLWLAATGSGSTFVAARIAPNATAVAARLTDLSFAGLGSASLGSPVANRLFSPNGDGRRDTLRISWTNTVALDTLSLDVRGIDGTSLGTIDLSSFTGAGAQAYSWNGRVGASALPDGRYVLQLVATDAGVTYTAPSARPVTAAQIDAFAVTIDRLADAGFTPLSPVRVLDTRTGRGLGGRFSSRTPRTLTIAGTHGIPADAVAVTVDVTAIRPTTNGRLAVTTTPKRSPAATTAYTARGDVRSAGATVPLSAGKLSITWIGGVGSRTHVAIDVTGYYRPAAGSGFTSLVPTRLVNTRTGLGLSRPLPNGTPRTVAVAGTHGIPADAVAVTLNVTALRATTAGNLTVTPTATGAPGTVTVHAPKSTRRTASTTVGLTSGRLSIVWVGGAGSRSDVIVDVTGYVRAGGAGLTRAGPRRIANSAIDRLLAGPLANRSTRTVTLAGRSGIPSDAKAITVEISVVGPTSAGYVAVGPSPTTAATAGVVHVPPGEKATNGATLSLGSGRLSITWVGAPGSRANVQIEITGYIR
jgi:spore germination protein YaaH